MYGQNTGATHVEALEAKLAEFKKGCAEIEGKLKFFKEAKNARENYDRVSKALNKFSTQIIALDCYLNTIKNYPEFDGHIEGDVTCGNFKITAADFTGRNWSVSFRVNSPSGEKLDSDKITGQSYEALSAFIQKVVGEDRDKIKVKQVNAAKQVEEYAAILKKAEANHKEQPIKHLTGHIGGPICFLPTFNHLIR